MVISYFTVKGMQSLGGSKSVQNFLILKSDLQLLKDFISLNGVKSHENIRSNKNFEPGVCIVHFCTHVTLLPMMASKIDWIKRFSEALSHVITVLWKITPAAVIQEVVDSRTIPVRLNTNIMLYKCFILVIKIDAMKFKINSDSIFRYLSN